MKILIAPDKFKGSLTAEQVCLAVEHGIKQILPDCTTEKFPMADGGEGTGELLTSIAGGTKMYIKARDPLFRTIETWYGLSPDGKTAFIEMAGASGLQFLKPKERNPLFTSTIGTGDMIAHALRQGAKTIVLGCGGSATNDAGIGMAVGLGFLFLDSNGIAVEPIGNNLSKIETIDTAHVMREIHHCKFILISDVNNTLYGKNGAAHIYAPQKGATPEDVDWLDKGLEHVSGILEKFYGPGITDFPGAGAAGGIAVSAGAFLNAEIKSGTDFIFEFAGLEEKIKDADLIITGEGKFDEQSLHGKVVSGISKLCLKNQKRLWVICGTSEVAHAQLEGLGIEKVLEIASLATSLKVSMEKAEGLIEVKIRSQIINFLSIAKP